MEARIAWFVVGQAGEQERESHKAQVNSPGLFSAAVATKEVTIQQLSTPAVLAHCQLPELELTSSGNLQASSRASF